MAKLTIKDLFFKLFTDNEFTDYIIYLNTQVQLYQQGVNADGKLLSSVDNSPSPLRVEGGYSENTIKGVYGVFEGKEQLGLPTDHITLFQHGDFYKSFVCKWNSSGNGAIDIKADTIKDGVDLLARWGQEVIGLDEDSLEKLRIMAKEKIQSMIKQILQAA